MLVILADELDYLLNDVVAVLVLHAAYHVVGQLLGQRKLLHLLDHLNGLLDDPAPLHLQGKLQHMPPDLLAQGLPLQAVAMLQQSLDHIVAEHVHDELQRMRQDLLEYQGFLLRGCRLEFLLDEAGPMLVLAELHDVVLQLRKFDLAVARPEVLQQLAFLVLAVLGVALVVSPLISVVAVISAPVAASSPSSPFEVMVGTSAVATHGLAHVVGLPGIVHGYLGGHVPLEVVMLPALACVPDFPLISLLLLHLALLVVKPHSHGRVGAQTAHLFLAHWRRHHVEILGHTHHLHGHHVDLFLRELHILGPTHAAQIGHHRLHLHGSHPHVLHSRVHPHVVKPASTHLVVRLSVAGLGVLLLAQVHVLQLTLHVDCVVLLLAEREILLVVLQLLLVEHWRLTHREISLDQTHGRIFFLRQSSFVRLFHLFLHLLERLLHVYLLIGRVCFLPRTLR